LRETSFNYKRDMNTPRLLRKRSRVWQQPSPTQCHACLQHDATLNADGRNGVGTARQAACRVTVFSRIYAVVVDELRSSLPGMAGRAPSSLHRLSTAASAYACYHILLPSGYSGVTLPTVPLTPHTLTARHYQTVTYGEAGR